MSEKNDSIAPLRIGLVGCGIMGTSLGDNVRKVDGAKLVLVCDTVEEQAREAADRLSVPFETDVDATLARDDLHGVIIATPPFLHEPLCVAAANHGKHVFVEKPMAPTTAACDRMIEAVQRAQVRLMVGHILRFFPVHGRIKQMVDQGAVGKPLFVQFQRVGGGFGGHWARPWRLKREMSGGMLMEVNAHEIDFMRYLCGEVSQVFAVGANHVIKEADYPDLAVVTLSFVDGAVGTLHASQAYKTGDYCGRIDGTDGSLLFDFGGENRGIRHRRDGEDDVFIAADDLTAPNATVAELAAWIKSIRDGTDPPVSSTDGRATVQIAEAAYESIDTGAAVRL